MGISTPAIRMGTKAEAPWLRSRDWDLTWISLSVILVTLPYITYLIILNLGIVVQPLANLFGTSPDSISRNIINAAVALLIGGPHMYATFTRTALDHDFARNHQKLIKSSLLIPIVVTSLAFYNLTLLLTIFFFWASIHVLHQIIYITDLYNHKQMAGPSLFSRLSDYAVILTSLYPLAAWRIANGAFNIGANNLSMTVGLILPLGSWMVWLAGAAFFISLVVWLTKTTLEWQNGILHWPKTLFIALTVTASFWVPALGNLDTAFQGMNLWHSLQYLALTWMLNNLRQRRGELDGSPFVKRISTDGSARRYYLFNVSLTVGDIVLAAGIFFVLFVILNYSFDYAFDRSYYIAVLSFLWIHYYHDHYLFAHPDVIEA